MTALTWIGIALCVSQSAIFSGLNLAMFGVSKLRLQVESSTGNPKAKKLLKLREDPNFLLTTILWGNVAINVLLTLLSGSVLAGVGAFLFSTVVITFAGEIFPQAYFSRNALKMAALLAPLLRVYQVLLYPVAKPVALILDKWLGKEGVSYFQERDLREMIKQHIQAEETDIDRLEGMGALNFLEIDDVFAADEGEDIDPESILELPCKDGNPVLPKFERTAEDVFLRKIQASGKKWIIVLDEKQQPRFMIDADGFLRGALFGGDTFRPSAHMHRPVLVTDPRMPLGKAIAQLTVFPTDADDDVVDQDTILVWGEKKRVITGADILGRLLRGIARRERAGVRTV